MTKPIQWKPARGKTWRQKLEQPHANHGKILPIPPRMQKRLGKGTMLIPRPKDVDAIMRRVRPGKLITTSLIRAKLALKAGADSACPLCTGIFVRVAAEAAEEDRRAHRPRITPYWRTIKDDGGLLERFPGGPKAQAARLREEGFRIEPGRGKRPPRVLAFEEYLVR